jgi:nucleoside-diphosphate-sugar epimerase
MRVTALTRNSEKAAVLRAMDMQVIEADLADPAWHDRVPAGPDYVLNCVSSGGGGAEGYRHSYLAGMKSVLSWAEHAAAGTMVYTGSTSVYPQDNGALVDETAPTTPQNERSGLLLETENLLRESTVFTRWFILRLAGIYGPGRHHVLDQIRTGQHLTGSATHRLNLAHRDDIGAAIWAAFAAPDNLANQVFNVADDAPATKGELATWLAESLQLPPPQFDPSAVSTRRRVVPDRIILNGKLRNALGWRPRYPDYQAGYASILGAL